MKDLKCGKIYVYGFPEGETESLLYAVKANGKHVPAHICDVSRQPYNVCWPGYQRPFGQTEEAAFITMAADGPVKFAVTVRFRESFKECVIRPLSKGVKVRKNCELGTVYFTVPGPGYYTVEFDGQHNALHIFIDAINDLEKEKAEANIVYGPGIHDIGITELHTGDRVYIDEGAVVYGGFFAKDSENISVSGHGILDNSKEKRTQGCISPNGCFKFFNCRNFTLRGLTLRDSCVWAATLFGCDNMVFDGLKTIGMWRYNSDGIDFVNSRNGYIKNCFLRNFDDVIVLKGLKGYDRRNVENITAENCVLWCDWGRALEIGAETCADEYRNITFENIDIIHGDCILMDLQNGDRASVHDIHFTDIRCEYSKWQMRPVYQNDMSLPYPDTDPRFLEKAPENVFVPVLFKAHLYCGLWSKDMIYGENYNISLNNIQLLGDIPEKLPAIVLQGVNETNRTYGITITGLFANGRAVPKKRLNLEVNEFADYPKYSGKIRPAIKQLKR